MLMRINNPDGVSVKRGVDFAEGQLLNAHCNKSRAGISQVPQARRSMGSRETTWMRMPGPVSTRASGDFKPALHRRLLLTLDSVAFHHIIILPLIYFSWATFTNIHASLVCQEFYRGQCKTEGKFWKTPTVVPIAGIPPNLYYCCSGNT